MNPQSFIASLSFDIRLAPYDIEGSIAHARMLSKCRIISSRDAQRIIKGLEMILRDLGRGKRLPPEEDIHFAIDRELIRRIGPVGGKLHTARSGVNHNPLYIISAILGAKTCLAWNVSRSRTKDSSSRCAA